MPDLKTKPSIPSVKINKPRDLIKTIGFDPVANGSITDDPRLLEYINIKLTALGCPIYGKEEDFPYLRLAHGLLVNHQEKNRLLSDYLCPADQRIQDFLNAYLSDVELEKPASLPVKTFVLDRHGLSRALSFPPDSDSFESDIVTSHRVQQGVLHNPMHDRRTTKGVFHITEGGLPIPADKKAVPKITFARLLAAAVNPPQELLQLPLTSRQEAQACLFVSLLLRPVVSPEVPGVASEKSLETRFFVPGNLVSNLDFVESIFGNGGDPYLAENDAGLDVEHWTGHTGCVILAPHLTTLTKKELGLPRTEEATERQKRDEMCWDDPEELYNGGTPFKITARDHRGVMVTLIADNYFGYCKKEVKTQISYSANLYGQCEEEHAGGAIAFPSYDLGEDFSLSTYYKIVDHTFEEVKKNYAELMDIKPEGYGIDKTYPNIFYVPEDVKIALREQKISWMRDGTEQSLKLLPDRTYVLPSGYKVEMHKPAEGRRWRLIGTTAEGTFCHKPCTVSGGGKSEISKSIFDAIIHGPVFVFDFKNDMERAVEIMKRDYSNRFRDTAPESDQGRAFLDPERSLGSVIKLLTPSPLFTDEYNAWLQSLPLYLKEMVMLFKRFYKAEWGDDWTWRFSVDNINGVPGHELKYLNQKIITSYLRVGYDRDGAWRTFGLRKDFFSAKKIQTEDDISASIVVPADSVKYLHTTNANPSIKFVKNCEYRLFQRPDDAIIRGYDKQTEKDFSRSGNFFSNYEPLDRTFVRNMTEDAIQFDHFTKVMQNCIRSFAESSDGPPYLVSPSHPRLVNGVPCKNPRYLQNRPDLEDPRASYLANVGARFYRRIPMEDAVPFPVNAVLPGRRNNPPEEGIRPLCVYNPIHYMELPELFIEYIASMTGKSPSTTGAGSEGALTKGPFNALPTITDLNNALVSYALTGYSSFLTAAGYVGPHYQVAHDISLLMPEIWCRMFVHEREPQYLIENGFLEKCTNIEHEGKSLAVSRLGYRITAKFVNTFFGRVFSNPAVVITEEMLRPELQDQGIFIDGMKNIIATHERVAALYFEDGTIEGACPPLRALLNIMAYGEYEGAGLDDPEIRALFEREAILGSDWYRDRLTARQKVETGLWSRHVSYLEKFLSKATYAEEASRLDIQAQLAHAREMLEKAGAPEYPETLTGTLGVDPYICAGD